MARERDCAQSKRRCLLISSAMTLVLVGTVLGATSTADAGTMSKSVYGYIYDYEADPIPDILVTVNILIGETTTIRSTLTDTTGPADSTPTGFYTVTFTPDAWMEGDTIEVIVSYSGDQAVETKVITGEGAENIDVQFEYAIPQFGSMLGFVIAAGLVAVVAIVALGRKKGRGQ